MALADVIVPAVFADYVIEKSIEKSALFQSGVMTFDAQLSIDVNGGGDIVNVPFFKDLFGDDEVGGDDGVALTPSTITTSQDVATKVMRGKAFDATDLSAELSGEDPMGVIADKVADYWVRRQQAALISTLNGVFADALLTSHTLDVSANTDGTEKIGSTNVLNAKQLLGDASDMLATIVLHSSKYTELQIADLIQYVKDSDNNVMFSTYLGYRVIVDDTLVPDADGNYSTYLMALGAIAYADVTRKVPVETDRDSLAGVDVLVTRKGWVQHIRGVKWNDATGRPTNALLADGTKWTKVYEDKNIRVVKLITK
jgi:hypothetical protein